MSNKCEVCEFKNPKATVTMALIMNGKLLMVQRNEEPFKDKWDLVGGYMQDGESTYEAAQREFKEETGLDGRFTFVDAFPGVASWRGKEYPILSNLFLVELIDPQQKIILDGENKNYDFFPFFRKNTFFAASCANVTHLF